MIEGLERKYAGGRKRPEPSDDEFAATQAMLDAKRNAKRDARRK